LKAHLTATLPAPQLQELGVLNSVAPEAIDSDEHSNAVDLTEFRKRRAL
jgi:hypothetical protein